MKSRNAHWPAAFVVVLTGCGSGASNAPPETAPVGVPPAVQSTRLLSHILHMGQSLASGEDAFPVVTIADTGYGNFQFRRGVHTWRMDQPAYCVAPQTR